MPACKGRSGHHARPYCFPPFGGGIIKSTEHTATPWLRAKPEDQQGKSGENPALALEFLQAVSVERMRAKGLFARSLGNREGLRSRAGTGGFRRAVFASQKTYERFILRAKCARRILF